MKFIDTFNEDDKKKLIKKAKLIYSVLKKGTITRSDGVKFSYELGDNMVPSVVDGEIELFAFITKIIERTYCPINEIAMSDLIIKKFDQFNIKVDLQIPKSIEIVKYQGKKPWELNEEIDRAHLKKMKKKGELVYKLYKTGKLVSDREDGEIHYTYELSDKKLINAYGDEISVSPDNIKIKYHNQLTNKFALLPITDSIKKRFHNHGITLNIPRWTEIYIDEWKEPLNEEIDIDKERNRVKTVHKAVRKGIVNVSGTRFRYELPEEYTFHVVDEPHLQVTAIKFTFYNKDLTSDVGGGHGLPLKIWRIEEGKDVYLNKMLTGQDVGDISYNDEYGITTKTGVEYVNAKNKVRNRYRNFDINAIMTTPSDTVMVNENHEEYKEKQIKKGKTIYKALKKGTIGGDDPEQPHFSYELPNDFSVDTNNVGIIISLNKIKIKQLNRKCNIVSNADFMGFLIRKRFSHFGIVLTSSYGDRYFEYDIEPWERPTINEETDNNLTEKDRKKIELIYKLFKRGKYTIDDMMYNYVLPDEFWTSNDDETGELVVVLTMDPTQRMKLYSKMRKEDGNLYHREVPVKATQYASLYDDAKKRIKEKFERFNIKIVF